MGKIQEQWNEEKVKKILENKSLKLASDFTNIKEKHILIDEKGYLYYTTLERLVYKNISPEIFHKHNPYTVENIKKYIELNNISTVLISLSYNNNSEELKWKCDCGKIFERSWNRFSHGAVFCVECARNMSGINRRIPIEEVEEVVKNNGYHIGENIGDVAIANNKFSIYDDDGYFYEVNWGHFKAGKRPEKFHPYNKYSIQNINRFLELNRNSEYCCVSETYQGNNVPMIFRHISCGCEFEATLVSMQGKTSPNKKDRYYKRCPKCNTNKVESNHALVLKQIFLHEYQDTITEEKSCINPKTNYPLPTDIVNHRLKIAVEVQSSYHDTEERKRIDKFKKEFWVNKGYNFYDPDIRDYSILEMVQIFFP